MTNKAIIILLSIFFLTLFSCREVYKMEESPFPEADDFLLIEVKPNDKAVDFLEYIDSVYYVRLDLTDESIIGQIDRLIVFEDRIYIMDWQTSSIFIFDMKGRFLSKICRIGNGPGEYVKLHYFDIDGERRHIVLIDLMSYWALRYDLNGKYVSRKKIRFNTEGFASLPDGGYVSFSNFRNNTLFMKPEYNLIYFDSLMQIEKAFFPYNSKNFFSPFVQFTGTPGGPFYSFNGETFFHYKMKNEVYQVIPEGLYLKYRFDFDGKNFNYSAINKKNGLKEYVRSGKYFINYNVRETPGFLAFTFSENSTSKVYAGFYSKDSGNTINSTSFVLKFMRFFSHPVASYEDWFVAEFSVDGLLRWKKLIDQMNDTFVEKGYKGERDIFLEHKALIDRKRLTDSLTLDDNSVLMFFKLKPF